MTNNTINKASRGKNSSFGYPSVDPNYANTKHRDTRSDMGSNFYSKIPQTTTKVRIVNR